MYMYIFNYSTYTLPLANLTFRKYTFNLKYFEVIYISTVKKIYYLG